MEPPIQGGDIILQPPRAHGAYHRRAAGRGHPLEAHIAGVRRAWPRLAPLGICLWAAQNLCATIDMHAFALPAACPSAAAVRGLQGAIAEVRKLLRTTRDEALAAGC